MKRKLWLLLLLFLIPVFVLASTTASRQYNFVDDKNNGIPITASRMDTEFDNVITKLNQKVIINSSAPSSPIAGMLWYDSTNKYLKQYRNSEWVVLAVHVGTAAMSTPQEGDLWYDSTNNLVKAYNGSTWDTFVTTGANSSITSLSGLTTPLSIAQGGTNSTTASDARTALGLGTIATQANTAVNIDGGTIDGVTITGGTVGGAAIATTVITLESRTNDTGKTTGMIWFRSDI